jgi:hypothetical protein
LPGRSASTTHIDIVRLGRHFSGVPFFQNCPWGVQRPLVESRRCISVSSRPLRVGILVLIRSWSGSVVRWRQPSPALRAAATAWWRPAQLVSVQRPLANTRPPGTPCSRMPLGMLNRFRSRWGQRAPVSGTAPAPAAEPTLSVNTDSVDVEGEHFTGTTIRALCRILRSGWF